MGNMNYRWKIIKYFINEFIDHRASNYYPSDRICVYEPFCMWYRLGRHWMNMELPNYVAMDRKHEIDAKYKMRVMEGAR